MATAAQIAQLRLLIAESTEDIYTDAALSSRIDGAGGNMDLLARDIWVEKAASYAALPDISEAGSSRSMGKLHDNALKMVEYFNEKLSATVSQQTAAPRLRRLTR